MRVWESPDGGWSFVETLIVLAIMLILTSAVSYSGLKYIDKAKMTATKTSISSLELALESYYLDNGVYPSEAQGLEALWTRPQLEPVSTLWSGPYVKEPIFTDSWGNTIHYELEDKLFQLRSYGADGMPGGDDYDQDLLAHETL